MTMTSQVIDECGCVSSTMRFSQQQLKRANYTICGNQTDDDGKFPTSPIRCFLYTVSHTPYVSMCVLCGCKTYSQLAK